MLLTFLLLATTGRADQSGSFQFQGPANADSGGRLTVTESDVEFLPLWEASPEQGGKVGAGVGARMTLMDFSDPSQKDRQLTALRLPVQASLEAGVKTRVMAKVTPGLNTDMNEVDGHDFRISALLMGFYTYRPDLQLGAGALLSDTTGTYGLMPAAGVRWLATDNLTFDLFLPRPRVLYKITDVFSAFASAGPAGGQWNIGHGTPKDPERDLRYKAIQASAGVDCRLKPGMTLTVAGGAMFNRSLETEGGLPDSTLEKGFDVDDTLFVAVALRIASGGKPGP